MTTSMWLPTALALLLSACHNPGALLMPKPEIQIKERQNPKQAYQIVMTIENPPGPFGMIEGSAQYDVVNHKECGYIDPVSETISRINTHPTIEWKPTGNGQYIATVYADLMVDEDYYGRGVCRWGFTEARARLKATGAEAETRFVPGISAEEIVARTPLTLHFWNGYYPTTEYGDQPDFGKKTIEDVPAEKREEFFTITLTPKDSQP
jgi:hypothetical protein